MPPKKADKLKRAADDLDEALDGSPITKKKSKTNLGEAIPSLPEKVVAPVDSNTPNVNFAEKYEPGAALRLTKAMNSINFALDKINFHADVLASFDNELDDEAIALAQRINKKIEKWGAYHEKVEKAMNVLLKVAPKKKAGVVLSTQTAAGFLSSG
jgi:hypothetical protein